MKQSRVYHFLYPREDWASVRKIYNADLECIQGNRPGGTFAVENITITSLPDMEEVLESAPGNKCFMVQGGLHNPDGLKVIMRRKELKPDCSATFKDCQRRIICFDFDNLESFNAPVNPQLAVEGIVYKCLPKPFHGAGYVCQLSNSYGTPKAGNKVKCHLFFELDGWYALSTVREWMKTYNKRRTPLFDASVLEPHQPIYICPPLIQGRLDHLAERVWYQPGKPLNLEGLIYEEYEYDFEQRARNFMPDQSVQAEKNTTGTGNGPEYYLAQVGCPEVNTPVRSFFMSALQCWPDKTENELIAIVSPRVDRPYASAAWFAQRMESARDALI